MTDQTFVVVVFALAVCVWIGWGVVAAARARHRLAGTRLVTCPETGTCAAVQFDRTHAAITALVHDEPDMQLESCSRWAERGPCDQPCVGDALDPESATSAIVAHWAKDKRCVYCRKPLVDAPLVGHRMALVDSDGVTTEWPDVPAERLTDVLRSRAPVCWDCHVVETFRRTHPELVTDR